MATQAQNSDQGRWLQYGRNQRYNPDTGEIQYDRSGTGDWQTVAGAKYDPQDPLGMAGLANPQLQSAPSDTDKRQFLVNAGGYALPTPDLLRQIYMMQQMGGGQGGAPQAGTPQAGMQRAGTQVPGYYGGATGGSWGSPGGSWGPSGGTTQGSTAPRAGATGGGNSMASWTDIGRQYGLSQADLNAFQRVGWDPDAFSQAAAQGRGFQDLLANPPGPQQPKQQIGGPGALQPEQVALQQMAQIDPTTEALRQQIASSYLSNLGGPPAPQFDMSQGVPTGQNLQSYLDLYKQIDPSGFAQRSALAGKYGSYLDQLQQQAALGSQLDPGTIREVEQGVRRAQGARGNVYGTPQLVQETMQRGTMGEQRRAQRQAALGQGLQGMQGYLTSGAGMGDVANQLFNQGYTRYLQGYGQQLGGWQAGQNAQLQRQQAALGYLASGQTPYQAGASYYDRSQAQAAQAAQGGPQYNPQALGQQYTGAGAPSFPQYGLDMSQMAGNWYNNLNSANLQAYNLGQAYGQKGGSGMGAATGALGGAASGALAGSAAGPWGTVIGAGVGALAGGLSGYSK